MPKILLKCSKSNYGFSLMELVAVIGIIGILAVAAIPSYRTYVYRSRVYSTLSILERIKTLTMEYYQQNNSLPTLAQLGYSTTSNDGTYSLSNDFNGSNSAISYVGSYRSACTGAGLSVPCIWVMINAGSIGQSNNKNIVFGYDIQENKFNIICTTEMAVSTASMPTNLLPKGCRLCTGVNTGCVTY